MVNGGWDNIAHNYAYGRERRATVRTAVSEYTASQVFSSTENSKPRFNACSNLKLQGLCYPVSLIIPSGVGWYCLPYGRFAQPAGFTPNNLTLQSPAVLWQDLEDARRRAWWSMQPRFQGEFDALNFLYELKDFKDIARHICRIKFSELGKRVKSMKSKIKAAEKKVASGSTSEAVLRFVNTGSKSLAEAYLTKVFAIDPLIRDCVTFAEQLQTLVKNAQQEFFDRGKNIQNSHYTELIDEQTSFGTPFQWGVMYKGSHTSTTYVATMSYNYNYSMRTEWDAIKRMYGLDLNARVVWNALPFSFVLDYFLKVDQAIGFMQKDPNVELRMLQYCESLLTEASLGVHYKPIGGSLAIIGGSQPFEFDVSQTTQVVTGVYGSHYVRRLTSPNRGVALPRLTVPTSKQALNLSALVRALW